MRSDILNKSSGQTLQQNERFDTFVKHTRVVNVAVANSEAAGTNSEFWVQPANSVLTNCYIVCTDALAITSGDVGYSVGTAAAGVQIIAAAADEILDGGTDVAVGAVTYPGMGVSLPGGDAAADAKVGIDAGAIAGGMVYDVQDDTTHVASIAYTASARNVYCNIITSQAADSDGGGNFAFCWEYIQFA